MGRTRDDDPYLLAARDKCAIWGLHPKHEPHGDGHHTDFPPTAEDRAIGDALAWFLGSLFADVDGEFSPYWYHQKTSADEWTRVARALRVHGLTITDHRATILTTCRPTQ